MTLDNWIKVFGIVGVVISFLWGVWQWKDKSEHELKQRTSEAARSAETRRLEATKPFLERQLKLYTEASQVAAQIATQGGSEAGRKARARFWELYWGELALVENREVEAAMKRMGDAILAGAAENDLKRLSLNLAHACRASLDLSWGHSRVVATGRGGGVARSAPVIPPSPHLFERLCVPNLCVPTWRSSNPARAAVFRSVRLTLGSGGNTV